MSVLFSIPNKNCPTRRRRVLGDRDVIVSTAALYIYLWTPSGAVSLSGPRAFVLVVCDYRSPSEFRSHFYSIHLVSTSCRLLFEKSYTNAYHFSFTSTSNRQKLREYTVYTLYTFDCWEILAARLLRTTFRLSLSRF